MTDTGMTNATTPFVQVRNLKMHFPVTDGVMIQTTVAQVKACLLYTSPSPRD